MEGTEIGPHRRLFCVAVRLPTYTDLVNMWDVRRTGCFSEVRDRQIVCIVNVEWNSIANEIICLKILNVLIYFLLIRFI